MRIPFCSAVLFSAAALALPARPAAAQAPADSAAVFKHEVGLTASPQLNKFFTANLSLPVGLLYKRHLRGARYLRLGTRLSYSAYTRDDPYWPTINDDFSYRRTDLEATAGLEWVRPLGRRWAGFAGFDAGVGYTRDNNYRLTFRTDNTGIPAPVSWETHVTDNTYAGLLRPLAGLRFYVTPFLYLSAETSLTGRFSHFVRNAESKQVRIDTNEVIAYTINGNPVITENRWSVGFRLLQQLTVHYCFKRITPHSQ